MFLNSRNSEGISIQLTSLLLHFTFKFQKNQLKHFTKMLQTIITPCQKHHYA